MSEDNTSISTERRRGPIGAEFRGPGPFAYYLPTAIGSVGHTPTKEKAPAYSLLGRHHSKIHTTPGPYGCPAGVNRRGRQKAPAYSIVGRMKPLALEKLPGPGAYSSHLSPYGLLSTDHQTPAYSFGQRWHSLDDTDIPAPSSYTLPASLGKSTGNLKTAPAWSIHCRPEYGSLAHEAIKNDFPSPSSYDPVNLNVIKTSPRACRITGRLPLAPIARGPVLPAPGSYDPNYAATRKTSKGFTMGIRHSEYVVVPCINDPDMGL